jgi:hypothetical protein
MTNVKDTGFPEVPTKNLTAANISLALGGIKSKKVAFLADKNCVFFSAETNLQRPMTAVSVTRRGQIKHSVVSASLSDHRKIVQGQNKRELVVFLPSDHQLNTMKHGGGFHDLDSRNELPYKLSKLAVSLPEIRRTRVRLGENIKSEQLYQQDRSIVSEHGLKTADSTMLRKLSSNQPAGQLPIIGDHPIGVFKRTFERVKDHELELENHLKRADEDYDQYVEKASILFNWISSQNEQ